MGRSSFAEWTLVAVLGLAACTKLESASDRFGARVGSKQSASGGAGGVVTEPLDAQTPDGPLPPAESGPHDANVERMGTGGEPDASSASGGTSGRDGGAGGAGPQTGSGGTGGVDDAGPVEPICIDPRGLHGLGCFTCAPTDIVTLENACTTSTCTRFDNAPRLTKLTSGGGLPPLPASAGGAPGAGGATATGGVPGSGGTMGGTGGSTGTGNACEDLKSRGRILYVTGSSAAKPFLQQIAQQIAAQNVFIVYTSTGSCVGVDAVVNGTPMKTGPSPAPAVSATYWDSASSSGTACDLPSAGVTADLGVSDVFAASCSGFELVNLDGLQIRDAHGPIQTMTFVVPANSRFSEISAQAAYFVYGFGADGGVLDPTGSTAIWSDEDQVQKRSAGSGTQSMLAAAIGVPPAAWKGKGNKTSDDVAAAIQAAGNASDTADKAIGILAADYIDTKNLRAQIRMLAYQDTLQRCAVYPDSTATAHDKRNVRDGHYPIWGPLHLLYKADSLGNPLNPDNRGAMNDILGYLSGTKPLPNGVRFIDVYAQSGLVPECAMHVSRTKDGGNLKPYHPTAPCSCLFEAKATGSTDCKPCVVQGDCGAGETCSQGYCER